MLSVIIGTKNDERALVRTLSALVPAAATGTVREVIVADGGSTDDTLEVADIAGCDAMINNLPLAQRLKEAAAKARSPWLMFLRPGVILEAAWADEATQFVQQMDLSDDLRAAAFRRSVNAVGSTSPFSEAISLLRASLIGTIDPSQGLVIAKRHYDKLGGHSASAADAESELLSRIGRRRIVRLRSGAAMLAGS
ncbi:MAG TPA: glycosyltransferase [Xanthobacteraceae bacterium]|jgi:glycosyltransferase involved in cell wall biosynthesis|nr:glycosyltransferase [Xanthobacteraceae bacterium]